MREENNYPKPRTSTLKCRTEGTVEGHLGNCLNNMWSYVKTNNFSQEVSTHWHAFSNNLANKKLKNMKDLLQRFNEANETTHDGFHIGGTIMVILLFLVFMATSFYLMVTNY